MADSDDDVRAKLQDVEAEIERLRKEGSGLTGQVGGQGDGAQDDGDTAAALTNLEESQAILATLEARRETLLGKLGES